LPETHFIPGKDSARPVPQRPLLICHIIFRLDVGGLENGLVNLINHLPADRFHHSIICLQYASSFRERIRQRDVAIHELHKGEGKALHLYRKVWDLLRDMQPDIVHTRNLPTIDMLLPARLAGVRRLVHSEHGLDQVEVQGSHRKYNWLRRLSRLLVRQYVSVSHDLAQWLHQQIGIPEHRITTIHNGVDTARFSTGVCTAGLLPPGWLPEQPFVIGTLGRFEKVKDQLNLVHAFIAMLQRRPVLRERLRLLLVGDGSLRGDIEALLDQHGLRELCWLPGFRDDAAALYRCLNVFVLPSRREGISNTILEAMASGLPVVATRVGGNPEIVDDQITGQLVPSQDPEEMASALLRYLDDTALLHRHSEAARRAALEKFSLASMVERYQQVYLDL
jgi:sugar transferase (PEP-CTERM/EpsH1 system associated)